MHTNNFDQNIFDVRTFTEANPAAGANFSYSPENNTILQVISLGFLFTAAAGGAGRQITILGADGGNAFSVSGADDLHAASAAITYFWSKGFNVDFDLPTGTTAIHPLPDCFFLMPGNTLESLIGGIQAGDQISGIQLRAKVWIIE